MPPRDPSTWTDRLRRRRKPWLGAAAAVLGISLAGGFFGSGAAAAAHGVKAHASSGGIVTYTAKVTIPAPPSSNFSGASAGGDGWAVALTSTAVYNVFHHAFFLGVNCHKQSDASQCWPSVPYKTISEIVQAHRRRAAAMATPPVASSPPASPGCTWTRRPATCSSTRPSSRRTPGPSAVPPASSASTRPSPPRTSTRSARRAGSRRSRRPATGHRVVRVGRDQRPGRRRVEAVRLQLRLRPRWLDAQHADVLQPHHLLGLRGPAVRGRPRPRQRLEDELPGAVDRGHLGSCLQPGSACVDLVRPIVAITG